MMKILALHADIGAAKNIIKNVCLLDDQVFFPKPLDGLSRLEFLHKFLYPSNYKNWIACEYTLKNYDEFGIEMESGDVTTTGIVSLSDNLREILDHKHFICDITNYDTAKKINSVEHAQVLSIVPYTMLGLNWQVRAYTMKYGADRMFNFTFENREHIDLFKEKYGNDVWVKVNLMNFYDMVRSRRRILIRSGMKLIPLEWIIYKNNWSTLIDYLNNFFNLNIPYSSAIEILSQWESLHWPVQETNDWEYRNIFKQFRPVEYCELLGLCEKIK